MYRKAIRAAKAWTLQNIAHVQKTFEQTSFTTNPKLTNKHIELKETMDIFPFRHIL